MKAALFALLAVALAGCSPRKDPKPQVSAAAAAAVADAAEGVVTPASAATTAGSGASNGAASGAVGDKAALPVIGPAPDWKLRDLNGAEVTFAQFKGKVVVVDFWATWCPPCRAEIPGYIKLYQKYGKDRLVIVGVSVDQDGPKVVQEFAKKFGINYPIVMGDDAVQSAFGGFDAIPTTFLIDREGRIRDRKVGAEPTEEYEKKIASLL
jgi:thiol-disulfide isomerase/thioredoxin